MTLRKPRVHPMIEKSSALLDRVLGSPEWDRLINIERFNILSLYHCVLGQTARSQDHKGNIPGDGRVPWRSFEEGCLYLDKFARKHPSVIEQIGLNAGDVNDAFDALVPAYCGRLQNEQWLVYLQWRRDVRDNRKTPRRKSKPTTMLSETLL